MKKRVKRVKKVKRFKKFRVVSSIGSSDSMFQAMLDGELAHGARETSVPLGRI